MKISFEVQQRPSLECSSYVQSCTQGYEVTTALNRDLYLTHYSSIHFAGPEEEKRPLLLEEDPV